MMKPSKRVNNVFLIHLSPRPDGYEPYQKKNTCKRKVFKLTVLKQGTYVEEGFSFDTLNA
jgi:hypothetical protein